MIKPFIRIIFCLCLLMAVSADARMGAVGMGGGAAVGGTGCSVETNEIGGRNVESADLSCAANKIYLKRGQADCAGTLAVAYMYSNSSTTGRVGKICVYTSVDSSPNVADTLIACSNTITASGGTAWESATFASGDVSNSAYYWVMWINGDVNYWNVKYTTSDTLYHREDAGWYASPPNTLPSSGWDSGAYAPFSAYVTIE